MADTRDDSSRKGSKKGTPKRRKGRSKKMSRGLQDKSVEQLEVSFNLLDTMPEEQRSSKKGRIG